jgi:alpha-beta hydrolase superfamily lysophospholipase
MTMITSSLLGADGSSLLLRHFPVDEPRASMLIVHGVSEHSGRWTHVAEFFAGRGHDVYCFDHRGHGGSGGPQMHIDRFDQFVDDLGVVVARVRGDRPLVMFGHSLGGLIAAAYAESDRPEPDLLVLSAPALGASIPKPLVAVGRLLDRIAPRTRIPAPVDGSQLSRDPAVGEDFRNDPLVHLATTARFGAAVLDAMDDVVAGVDLITVPTLVVHGGDDRLVPTEVSEPLGTVDGIERTVFPGLRHEMHNEPEAAEVLGFVAEWIEDRLSSG